MPLDGNVQTQAEEDELAKMSYACAVSVDMDFGSDGSGAYTSDVPASIKTYFGFTTADWQSFGTITDPNTFDTTIKGNLDNALPIEWSGQSVASGGHAFVLDGYTDDADVWYHFNWGWSGYSDGWFQLSNLNPAGEDFTDGQGCAYNIDISSDLDLWLPPTNLTGTILNFQDVSLSWTAPSSTSATLAGYTIYKGGEVYATVGSGTTSYVDYSQTVGNYIYSVKANYTGPDGDSPSTSEYTAEITGDPNYPIPLFVEASVVAYTRQQIDLTWNKPFTGSVVFDDGFEDTSFETQWRLDATMDNPPTGRRIGKVTDNFNYEGYSEDWFHGEEGSFGGGDTEYIHSGLYYAGVGYLPGDDNNYEWLTSPVISFTSGDELRYWTWSYGTLANPGAYYVYLYNGTFTESNNSTYLTNLVTAENIAAENANTNAYDYEEVVPITVTGDYRLCFVRWNGGATGCWQFMIDDIVVASSKKNATVVEQTHSVLPDAKLQSRVSDIDITKLPEHRVAKVDDPVSYDIYRNGSFADNVAFTGASEVYADTGFADGLNEYYVKAIYAGSNESIPSNTTSAYMDANPKPDYLTGVLNGSDVDLSWYKPYWNPPMWYGYAWDYDALWDYISGYTTEGNRTNFYGSELGFFYPCTLDFIRAAFDEYTDAFWTSNQFNFTVLTSAISDGSDSVLFTSGPHTAVAGEFYTVAIDPPLNMIKSWRVIVTPGNTADGSPWLVSDIKYDGEVGGGNSQASLDDGSGAAWYGISNDGYSMEWWIHSFVESSESPDITKSGWVSNTLEKEIKKPSLTLDNSEVRGTIPETDLSFKGMLNYNIYRNTQLIGTSALTTYTDVAAPAGDNTYYVTALYENPAGESAGSNEVMVHVDGAVLTAPQNVVIANNVITWDTVAAASSYNVYSSADPYGTFTFVTNVSTEPYTVPAGTKCSITLKQLMQKQ
jgi:fibronectin type 3 domain-containing protein